MTKPIGTSGFQRELGGFLRHQATDLLVHGVEIVPPRLFNEAIDAIRKRKGANAAVTVDEVVDYEMARAMRTLGKVNEAKGERGHTMVSKEELQRAIRLDQAVGAALLQVYNVMKSRASGLSNDELGREVGSIMKNVNIISESDSPVDFVMTKGKYSGALTSKDVMKAFAERIATAFDGQSDDAGELVAEIESAKATAKTVKGFKEWDDGDPQSDYAVAAAAFTQVEPVLFGNLKDVRFVRIGPKDEDGELATDQGLYLEMLVGKTKDGKLAGISWTVVET